MTCIFRVTNSDIVMVSQLKNKRILYLYRYFLGYSRRIPTLPEPHTGRRGPVLGSVPSSSSWFWLPFQLRFEFRFGTPNLKEDQLFPTVKSTYLWIESIFTKIRFHHQHHASLNIMLLRAAPIISVIRFFRDFCWNNTAVVALETFY